MYEAFLHAIWAPCVWHECVCCMCVSVSELNGGARCGVLRGVRGGLLRGVRRRAVACGVRRRAACGSGKSEDVRGKAKDD